MGRAKRNPSARKWRRLLDVVSGVGLRDDCRLALCRGGGFDFGLDFDFDFDADTDADGVGLC
jgi:hypothetical protein